MMEPELDLARISKWLSDIASTEDVEIDCDTLDEMLETIVAAAERGAEIRVILPQVAVHLDHCPECGGWYQVLVDLAGDLE